MNKNIIIGVLLVLLIVSDGFLIYSQQNNTSLRVKEFDLEKKINKALVYSEALDLYLDPIREKEGIPKRQNIPPREWSMKLEQATKETEDTDLVNSLKVNDTMNFIFFMEHATSKIVDILK